MGPQEINQEIKKYLNHRTIRDNRGSNYHRTITANAYRRLRNEMNTQQRILRNQSITMNQYRNAVKKISKIQPVI